MQGSNIVFGKIYRKEFSRENIFLKEMYEEDAIYVIPLNYDGVGNVNLLSLGKESYEGYLNISHFMRDFKIVDSSNE